MRKAILKGWMGLWTVGVSAGLLVLLQIAAPRQAAAVQASGSIPVLPSVSTVQVGVNFTSTVRINNTSTNTGGEGTANVPAALVPGSVVTVFLACQDAACATKLPGTVTFNSCTPIAAGVGSCVLDPADPTNNTVKITVNGTGVQIAAGGFVDLVSISLQGTTPVNQGFFFTRGETGGSDLRACSTVNPAKLCCTNAFNGVGNCTIDTCSTDADCSPIPGPPNTVCAATACALGGATGSSLLEFPLPTPTPTVTETPTPTPTPTVTNTPTETPTPTPTRTPTPTPTITQTPTQTPRPTNTPPPVPVIPSPTSPAGLLLVIGLGGALALMVRRMAQD